MRITIAGIRENINTSVTLLQSQWDVSKKRIKGNSDHAQAGNKLLAALAMKVTESYTECVKHNLPVTAQQIKSMVVAPGTKCETLVNLFKHHNDYVKRRVGVEVTKATYRKYQIVFSKVCKYLKQELNKTDIPLDQLNKGFAIGFELYLKADEAIGHNTTIKYIQSLKRVINFGIGMEWLKYDPFKAFKCTLHGVVRECLIQDEVDAIRAKHIPIQRLAVVRDLFIFSCYTGLAYVDLRKLKHSEISKGIDGGKWIYTYREKTHTRVPVPLLPVPLALLEQYKGSNQAPDSLVFPVPSNQKVNAYLHELADLCGITKRLTFHIARHTFATTITLSNGVPIETVSKMLGHTNIKTTQIYSKVVDSKISGDMELLVSKLAGKTSENRKP